MIRDAVEGRERADLDVSSRLCSVPAAGCQVARLSHLRGAPDARATGLGGSDINCRICNSWGGSDLNCLM
jgi:hypothetical protein